MSEATILFCQCTHAKVIPEEVKRAVHAGLLQGGLSFETVTDLCGLAARKDPWLKRLTTESESLTVLACYPRAVRWLLHAAGAGLNDSTEIFNMREQEAPEIIATLQSRRAGRSGTPGAVRGAEDGWIPWFPVIDYDRCSGCLQCKKFCLFGVFAEGQEGKTVVQNPASCKTNCPACARICPEAAIIFPKYAAAPINGSDEIVPATGEQSRIDLKTLLEGDLYEVLRNRGGDKSDVLEVARKLAEAERQQCARASGAGETSPEDAELMKPLCGCACDSGGNHETVADSESDEGTACCDPATGCCDTEDASSQPCCDPATGCCDEDKPDAEPGCGCEPKSGCRPEKEGDKPCCG